MTKVENFYGDSSNVRVINVIYMKEKKIGNRDHERTLTDFSQFIRS